MTRLAWPRGGLWRQPDFLKFWSAETISQFGTQISNLAIPLVAILLLDASPFEVAALGTIAFVPFLLLALPTGVWVDRIRRRPILIAGDLGRAALLGTIPVAYFTQLTGIALGLPDKVLSLQRLTVPLSIPAKIGEQEYAK